MCRVIYKDRVMFFVVIVLFFLLLFIIKYVNVNFQKYLGQLFAVQLFAFQYMYMFIRDTMYLYHTYFFHILLLCHRDCRLFFSLIKSV